jgi:hypothetical protein
MSRCLQLKTGARTEQARVLLRDGMWTFGSRDTCCDTAKTYGQGQENCAISLRAVRVDVHSV